MKLKLLKRAIKDFLLRRFTQCYGWLHPIKKQILFSSYINYSYADSGRMISEQMHVLFPDYQLVWLLTNKSDKYHLLPDYITPVFIDNKLTFYKQLAVSFCFITNEGITSNIYKRKHQLFIQTWHGDRPFKHVLYEEKLPVGTFRHKIIDNLVTDFCVSGSNKGTIQYREAFRYQGEIIQEGMPRNDKLINKNFDTAAIKKTLQLPADCYVVLYAPTFRDNSFGKQSISVDLIRTLKVLSDKYPQKPWICLLRAHSCSIGFQEAKTPQQNFVDVSDYPDMTDLLCISDMLLTDYSSCAGDFVLMHKPVILTVFDLEEYRQKCRSFKYALENTGFILAHNQKELEREIMSLTEHKIQDHYNRVMEFFGITETGKSASVICKKIDQFYHKHFDN